MSKEGQYRLATKLLHAGQSPDPLSGAQAVPIFATVAYNFKSTQQAADLFALKEFGHIYSRLSNPTNEVLERRLAAIEGGSGAVVFSSGMAAITAAIMTLVHAGENFISSMSLYGGTWTLFTQTFKNLGIEVRFFNPDNPEEIKQLADEKTRCVYLETIGNPKNDVPDFDLISSVAHAEGLPVIVDNTVATPIIFRPIEHGADVVVYSTTKYIGGHGVHVGGAVIDGGTFRWEDAPDKWAQFCKPDDAYHGIVFTEVFGGDKGGSVFAEYLRAHWLRDTGACMSPFAAFLFLLGLETLHVRMERHCQNAQTLAEWLSKHEYVEWVNYPGLKDHPHHANAMKYFSTGAGAIIGFGIKGGRQAGAKFIDAVKLASHLANIGEVRTLVIHPASTTHQQLTDEEQRATGVSPEYIRLCVGIEDVEDIKEDLDQALKASQR